MLESIVLGSIQGITEWLPISSEGMVVLAKVNLFGSGLSITNLIGYALFLHLGTFFAALIYFRKEVVSLLKSSISYKKSDLETKKQLKFYFLATLFSALVGLLILLLLSKIKEGEDITGKGITLIVGVMLWITAFLQLKRKNKGLRGFADLKTGDGMLLGIVQGFSILPGLSRSGITISTFLLRKFDESKALKMSFIMSLPAVLGGNILLNIEKFSFNLENILAFLFSFLLGLLTIHLLLKIAKKLNFGLFVCFFGLLIAISLFL